ncbi:MAG: GNAT family N-acetyltransferase [Burkholderiales bacterium]|nr:GNAT family N-acetyltransferase [Burkholderiales bacterium]
MTITIRRTSPKDAAALARLMGDPAVVGGLLQMPYPNEQAWQARLADNAAPGKPDLSLVAEMDGDVVGAADLHAMGIALRRRHAMGLGIVVARTAQGQGVGSALMTALCDYADRWLGVLRLELTVYADNDVALRLYRRFGFEIEGTFKGFALRDGDYVDALAMARLHPNPPRIGAPAVAPAPAD